MNGRIWDSRWDPQCLRRILRTSLKVRNSYTIQMATVAQYSGFRLPPFPGTGDGTNTDKEGLWYFDCATLSKAALPEARRSAALACALFYLQESRPILWDVTADRRRRAGSLIRPADR